MNEQIKKLQAQLAALILQFNLYKQSLMKSNREKIYDKAKSFLGIDASPLDAAPDEYGCADSVNQIFFKTFGKPIALPGISTTQLFNTMRSDPRFTQVTTPIYGDIIISPTGYGTNSAMPNGHVGIVAQQGIMSNTSATGRWQENYTLESWKQRYQGVGGYPVIYFRIN